MEQAGRLSDYHDDGTIATRDEIAAALDGLRQRTDLVQHYLDCHMTDPDGLVYSMTCINPRRPLRDADISDAVQVNQLAAPKRLWKAAMFSYEDTNMATAEYLRSQVFRYRATGSQQAAASARRSFGAIQKLAMAASAVPGPLGRPQFGFLPKPYGGLVTATESQEFSIDQYQRVMVALEDYHDELADEAEKQWIAQFLVKCCEFWDELNYTSRWFGMLVRWGVGTPHSVAFGLYSAATGWRMSGGSRFSGWLEIFRDRMAPLFEPALNGPSDNVAALTAMAMKRLVVRLPDEADRWRQAAHNVADWCGMHVDAKGFEAFYGEYRRPNAPEHVTPGWYRERGQGIWDLEVAWRSGIRRTSIGLAAAWLDGALEPGDELPACTHAASLLRKLGDPGYLPWLRVATAQDLPSEHDIFARTTCGLQTATWLRTYWQARSLLCSRAARSDDGVCPPSPTERS